MGIFDAIASAFDEDDSASASAIDIGSFEKRMTGVAPPSQPPLPPPPQTESEPLAKKLFGGFKASVHNVAHSIEHAAHTIEHTIEHAAHMQPGNVYIHQSRTRDALPPAPPPPHCGVPALDHEYRRRNEQLVQEMSRDFSNFSLAGLAWAEQKARADAEVKAVRDAEDEVVAKRRREEDAALAAKREMEDSDANMGASRNASAFMSNREAEEVALVSKWKSKFEELAAALEEAKLAHEKEKALAEQRVREEEALAREEAARRASHEAELAGRTTEAREAARREAELNKLRLASAPSLRSLLLVGPESICSALRFALLHEGAARAPTSLRQDDRSWWRLLHFLEADGLSPPLKGTEVGSRVAG